MQGTRAVLDRHLGLPGATAPSEFFTKTEPQAGGRRRDGTPVPPQAEGASCRLPEEPGTARLIRESAAGSLGVFHDSGENQRR